MGSKGSQTSTSTYTPPASVLANYNAVTGQAAQVAQTPYQPYTGETVAPVNATEQAGINSIQGAATAYQPYFNTAQGLIGQGTQTYTPTQFSQSAVQQYENPYNQSVINSTMAEAQQQDAIQQQQLTGNAIASGAWGGNRAGVAQGVLGGQQALANNATLANLNSQNYQQALGQFNTANTTAQNAASLNSQTALQGAGLTGTLGNYASQFGLSGAQALTQAGALQQQTQQNADTAAMQQFQAQQAYPFNTTQWLSNIYNAGAGGMGGTSSSSQPSPGLFGQIAGTGLAAAGVAGNLGWAPFAAASGGRIGYNKGGSVGYADGGGIPDLYNYVPGNQYSSLGVGNYVPVSGIVSAQSGIPRAPGVQQQSNGLPSGNLGAGSSSGGSGKTLGNMMGLNSNTATSFGPQPSGIGDTAASYASGASDTLTADAANFAPEAAAVGTDITAPIAADALVNAGTDATIAAGSDAAAAGLSSAAGAGWIDALLALLHTGGAVKGYKAGGGIQGYADAGAVTDGADVQAIPYGALASALQGQTGWGPNVDAMMSGMPIGGSTNPPPMGGLSSPLNYTPIPAGGMMGSQPPVVSAAPANIDSPQQQQDPAQPSAMSDLQKQLQANEPSLNKNTALMMAGLNMMAGRSPHSIQNIAEGAISGLQNYAGQQQVGREYKLKEIEAEKAAQQMANDMGYRNAELKIQQQNADTNAGYRGALEKQAANGKTPQMQQWEQFQAANPDMPIGQQIAEFGKLTAKPSAGGADLSGMFKNPDTATNENVTGQAVLADIKDPNKKAMAESILNGTADLKDYSVRQADRADMAGLLHRIDGNFDEHNFGNIGAALKAYNANGLIGKTNNAYNTLIQHVGEAIPQAMALDNQSTWTPANSITNYLVTHTGDPRVKVLDSTLNNVATEMAKALNPSGVVSDEARREQRKNLDAQIDSSGQITAVLKNLAALGKDKMSTNQQQYIIDAGDADYRKQKADGFIQPNARAVLNKLGVPVQNLYGQQAASPTATAAPSDADIIKQYPDAKKASNGKYYVPDPKRAGKYLEVQ